MKNIKRIFVLILILIMTFMLSACKNNANDELKRTGEETSVEETAVEETKDKESEEKKDQLTQEESNEKLKKEAIEADFVKANSGEIEKGTKLFLEGEVSVIMSEDLGIEFTLSTKEGDGYGMYSIWAIVEDVEVNEGDIVKVWGSYEGKDDAGIPKVAATIVEVQQ